MDYCADKQKLQLYHGSDYVQYTLVQTTTTTLVPDSSFACADGHVRQMSNEGRPNLSPTALRLYTSDSVNSVQALYWD